METRELLQIEEYFGEIQEKKNVESNLRAIERTLERCYNQVFHVCILTPQTYKSDFFGMNIYPATNTVDLMVDAILSDSRSGDVSKIWQECEEWFIEIDNKLLYNINLAANPQEIVAVLLHEIGHTVYSNTVPQRLFKVMRFKLMKANYSVQKLCVNPKFRKLFEIVILGACESKNFSYIDEKKEIEADKFVVRSGYGIHLDSFITKVISTSNNHNVARSDGDMDSDVNVLTEWTLENIAGLQIRKTKLKNELILHERMTPSPYIKSVYEKIKGVFFGKDGDTRDAMVSEQYIIDTYSNHVEESLKDFIGELGKLKKIKPSDIDVVRIEMDRIETLDDKYYVLDLIYDKLNLIDRGLEYYKTGNDKKCSQSKDTLEHIKIVLEEYRDEILKKKIVDKQYGLFIKVPKGYEG